MTKHIKLPSLLLILLALALVVSCEREGPTTAPSGKVSLGDALRGNTAPPELLPAEKSTATVSSTGLVEEMPYDSLQCAGVITFDDVIGGPAPGANYDAIFESNGADFAERFVGQTLSLNGTFDVVTGTPTAPLALQVGNPGQNLNVELYGTSQILAGLGPLGFPDFNAIGEGAFAMLFDFDQSQLGFQLVGGDFGSATVSFYRRDGSFIDSIVLNGVSNAHYGFRRSGGVHDIAGVLVQNTDPAGIGVDDICHDRPGVPGHPEFFTLDIHPQSCPNPINVKSQGVTPAALLGTATGDVALIDVASIRLEGTVVPVRHNFADVGTPIVDGTECACNTLAGDGIMDLTLKFKTQDIVAALDIQPGETAKSLTITGTLTDGTPFEASDCVLLKGLPAPAPPAGSRGQTN